MNLYLFSCVYVCMCVWVYGSMGVWEYGYMSVCTVFLHVHCVYVRILNVMYFY